MSALRAGPSVAPGRSTTEPYLASEPDNTNESVDANGVIKPEFQHNP